MTAATRSGAHEKGRLLIGVVLAMAYVGAAALSARLGVPVRPVFDGLAPPEPYRFVSPPPEFETANQPPEPLREPIPAERGKTTFASFATTDAQVQVSIPDDAFELAEGRRLAAEIVPLDPATTGEPPAGLAFTGNAYRIRVFDERDRKDAVVREPVTIIMRYPAHATEMLYLRDSGWTRIASDKLEPTLQLVVATKELGTFATGAPPTGSSGLWWAVGIASGIAAGLGLVLGIRERLRIRHAPP